MSFCSICLDRYEEDVNKAVVVINCSHVFHKECIERWYEINLIPTKYNEKELPDLLHCPICNIHHRNGEFRQIFLSVNNNEPRQEAHLGNDVEVVDVESDVTTKELKEKILRLEATIKELELERTVESKDVTLSFLRGQKHQSGRKRARMSSRSSSNSGNDSVREEFLRSGTSSYHLRSRKSR